MPPPLRYKGGVLGLFSPAVLGDQWERLVAAGLLVCGLTITAINVMARPAAGETDAVARMNERLEEIRKKDPGHPLFMILGAWILVGLGSAAAVHATIFIRLRRAQREPGKASLPDPTREPVPWGLTHVGIVFAGMILVQPVVGAALLKPPSIVLENGEAVDLRRKAVELGGVADDTSSTTRAIAVLPRKGLGKLARIALEPARGPVLSVLSGLPIVVNEVARTGAESVVLSPGDEIQAGPVTLHYEASSLTEKMLAGSLGMIATIALLLLVVLGAGGTPADLGLKDEGALGEVARGAVGYLSSIPLILIGMVASYALCRALGAPYEEHPLLRELEHAKGWRPIASLVLLAAVVAPVTEELLFRGMLLGALRRIYPSRVLAVAFSSFFFASIHPGLAHLVPIFVVGALFGTLRVTSRNGSLVGPMVAHALFNGVNIALQVAMLRA